MPRDPDSLHLITPADRWANAGDKAVKDLSTLADAIDRLTGWTEAYGLGGTRDLSREVWNRIFYELSSAAYEINSIGAVEYTNAGEFDEGAVINQAGVLRVALDSNGPGTNLGVRASTTNTWANLIGHTKNIVVAEQDAEVLKIRKFADSGQRIDPESTALTPTLSRATGWPREFTERNPGYTPRRHVLNQLFHEITSVIVEWQQKGFFEHNEQITQTHPTCLLYTSPSPRDS